MAHIPDIDRADLDAVEASLPDDPVAAAHLATALCAARCIDAGLDDDAALVCLDFYLKTLRDRCEREDVH